MNWTGGKLHRHSKVNKNENIKRQKRHFARSRHKVQNSTPSICTPFQPDWLRTNISYLASGIASKMQGVQRCNQYSGPRQRTLYEFPLTAPLAHRLASIGKRSSSSQRDSYEPNHALEESEPQTSSSGPEQDIILQNIEMSLMTRRSQSKQTDSNSSHLLGCQRRSMIGLLRGDTLEQRRKQLLAQDDWVGLSVSRPVKMEFQSRDDKEKIGKRRKVIKGAERGRAAEAVRAMHNFALIDEASVSRNNIGNHGILNPTPGSINVRIGKDALASQMTATNALHFSPAVESTITPPKPSSDILLFDDDEQALHSQSKKKLEPVHLRDGKAHAAGEHVQDYNSYNHKHPDSWRSKDNQLAARSIDTLTDASVQRIDAALAIELPSKDEVGTRLFESASHWCGQEGIKCVDAGGTGAEKLSKAPRLLIQGDTSSSCQQLFSTPTPLLEDLSSGHRQFPGEMFEISSNTSSSDEDVSSQLKFDGSITYRGSVHACSSSPRLSGNRKIGLESAQSPLRHCRMPLRYSKSEQNGNSREGEMQNCEVAEDNVHGKVAWMDLLSVSDSFVNERLQSPKVEGRSANQPRMFEPRAVKQQSPERSNPNEAWRKFIFGDDERSTTSSTAPKEGVGLVGELGESQISSLFVRGSDQSISAGGSQRVMSSDATSHARPGPSIPASVYRSACLDHSYLNDSTVPDASVSFRDECSPQILSATAHTHMTEIADSVFGASMLNNASSSASSGAIGTVFLHVRSPAQTSTTSEQFPCNVSRHQVSQTAPHQHRKHSNAYHLQRVGNPSAPVKIRQPEPIACDTRLPAHTTRYADAKLGIGAGAKTSLALKEGTSPVTTHAQTAHARRSVRIRAVPKRNGAAGDAGNGKTEARGSAALDALLSDTTMGLVDLQSALE